MYFLSPQMKTRVSLFRIETTVASLCVRWCLFAEFLIKALVCDGSFCWRYFCTYFNPFSGLFFILPCTDNYCNVDLRTVSFNVPPQEVSESPIELQLLYTG